MVVTTSRKIKLEYRIIYRTKLINVFCRIEIQMYISRIDINT